METVLLTKQGVGRVLGGEPGMLFHVDHRTADRDGKPTVTHVRDYRHKGIEVSPRLYRIWTLGKGDYEAIN